MYGGKLFISKRMEKRLRGKGEEAKERGRDI